MSNELNEFTYLPTINTQFIIDTSGALQNNATKFTAKTTNIHTNFLTVDVLTDPLTIQENTVMVSYFLCKWRSSHCLISEQFDVQLARHFPTLICFPDRGCILALYIPAFHPVSESLAGDAMFLGCTVYTPTTFHCHQCCPEVVICVLPIWSYLGWPVGEHCKSKYINYS